MSGKFHNKYRISSARLKNWDYRSDGAYFITLCTRNKECYFGEIANSQFIGNPIGLLAEKYWLEIPKHFPFIELGNFVVMPNHIHGILIVDNSKIGNDHSGPTPTPTNVILPDIPNSEIMSKISPKSGAVSTIIRSYKSAVSKHANSIHLDFYWQTRFHDHIIRNSRSFELIQNYIENNPANWSKDKFHQ